MITRFFFGSSIYLFCLLATTGIFAQPGESYTLPDDPIRNQITPPSPDVWQFMQYGDYPVSRETGVPQISIPIYNINSGELSVPITLSYHAGGIKVDDIASWVGLGWSLNAGGVISRTIRGTRDESNNGLLFLKDQVGDLFNEEGILDPDQIDVGLDEHYLSMVNMREEGSFDSEPDVFSYNFLGYSGKFFLDSDGNAVTQPKSDIDFQATIIDHEITEIAARTPDGTTFIFNVTTKRVADSYFGSGNVSWYLHQIRSQNASDVITFYYRELIQSWDPLRVETIYMYLVPETGYGVPTFEESNYNRMGDYEGIQVLDYIEFSTGKVDFNSVDDREDDYKTRLTSIEIFNKMYEEPIKTFLLNNSAYFISAGTSEIPSRKKRLKLVSMQEVGRNGESTPPYKFTYLETGNYQLRPRKSYAQDYWGYKNGNFVQTLIPRHSIEVGGVVTGEVNTVYLGGANRESNGEYMKAGIISSIKYPTGGRTEFEFEANTVKHSYFKDISPSFNPGVIISPGSQMRECDTVFTAENYTDAVFSYAVGNTDPSKPGEGWVTLRNLTTDELIFSHGPTENGMEQQLKIGLSQGHQYRLYAYHSAERGYAKAYLRWSIHETVFVTTNKIVGGLRVKSIRNYDYDENLVRQKHYDYSEPNSDYSSGVYNATSLPKPEDYLKLTNYTRPDYVNCDVALDHVYSMSAHSYYNRGFPVGNVVTYRHVTETDFYDQQLTGKSVYEYDVEPQDEKIYFYNTLGYFDTFIRDRSILRGHLVSESHYDKWDSLTRDVQYSYETLQFENQGIRALKIGQRWEVKGGTGGVCLLLVDAAQQGCINMCGIEEIYEQRREIIDIMALDEVIYWKRLSQKIETVDGVSTITQYEYEPNHRHTNVIAAITQNSKGQEKKTEIRYAHELENSELLERNMIGIPLESDVFINDVLTEGTKVVYSVLNGFFMPTEFYQKLPDNSYRLMKEISSVNDHGRAESIWSFEGVTTSFIWGHNNSLPMAQVVNANPNQNAFTSFESPDDNGGWSYTHNMATTISDQHKTGNHSFKGNTVSKSGLLLGEYVVSFWARKIDPSYPDGIVSGTLSTTIDNDEWKYFAFTFDLSSSNSVSLGFQNLLVDELRLYPANALMTTYLHDPLIGVISTSDENGYPTYYQYDGLNRLNFVRDYSWDILNRYSYQYRID